MLYSDEAIDAEIIKRIILRVDNPAHFLRLIAKSVRELIDEEGYIRVDEQEDYSSLEEILRDIASEMNLGDGENTEV